MTIRKLFWRYDAIVTHESIQPFLTITLLSVALSGDEQKKGKEDFSEMLVKAVEPYLVQLHDAAPKVKVPRIKKTGNGIG